MFNCHSDWVNNMVENCLGDKNQKRKVFKTFHAYSEAVVEKLLVNLIRNHMDLNLKAVMMILTQGYLSHLKKRDNLRLMQLFAIKGVSVLNRERITLHS